MSALQDVSILAETAAYLRLSERKVAQMARDGKIAAIREGRVWLFPRQAITDYIERNSPALAATGRAPSEPVPPRRTGRKF